MDKSAFIHLMSEKVEYETIDTVLKIIMIKITENIIQSD